MSPPLLMVIAYACDPTRGSEPGAGGIWTELATRYAVGESWDCVVVTRKKHVTALLGLSGPSTQIHAPKSSTLDRLVRDGSRFHSVLWQVAALRDARRLIRERDHSRVIVHHLTYASDVLPGAIHLMPNSCHRVWGPVGSSDSRITRGRAVGLALRRLWVKWLVNRTDLTVAQSSHVAQSMLGAKTRVSVEPNVIVDLKETPPGDDAGPRPGVPVVLVSGVLNERKRVHLALESVRLARESWVVHVLGDGPERAPLEARFADLVSDGRVSFLGAVSRTQALRLVSDSSGVIHPSRREGAPWSVGEALALGKWVVAVRGSGADSLIELAADNGVVVQESDELPLSIASAVDSMVRMPGRGPCNRFAPERVHDLLDAWYFQAEGRE